MGKGKQQKSVFIELFNPSRSYLAGQIVQGRVIVQNDKPKKVKEVTILLEGSGRVHWTETETYTVHTTRTVNGKTQTTPQTKTRSVSYYADEKYVSQKISLAGDGHNLMTIPAGVVTYPFQFTLPTSLPSSFTSRIGLVSYFLEAELRRPFLKINKRQAVPFTVNGIYDLNLDPISDKGQEVKKAKGSNFFACRKGQLGYIMRLPTRSGFVPGEMVDVNVEIANSSNKKVNGVKVKLLQNTTYYAQGRTNYESKVIAQVKGPEVDAGDNESWTPDGLIIPPVPPTRLGGICRIIDVQYVLHMEMSISGLSLAMVGDMPVMIGTIPLRSRFEAIRQLPQMPMPPVPVPSPSNEKSEMGFVVPTNDKGNGDQMPSMSASEPQFGQQFLPSAPVFQDYPDLPPPSYAEAVSSERFSWDERYQNVNGTNHAATPTTKDMEASMEENQDRDPSAPPMYTEFVPNYITYGSAAVAQNHRI